MRTNFVPVERWFTRQVSAKYADLVERRLTGNRAAFFEIPRRIERNRFGSLLGNLLRYFRLVFELMLAKSRGGFDLQATLFYERADSSVHSRKLFLEWNKPDGTYLGITGSNRILRPGNTRAAVRLMVILLITMPLTALWAPSIVTPRLVRIVRTVLLVESYLRMSDVKSIYLFRVYTPEVVYLSAFLKEQDYVVHLVASGSPLSFHNRILIGDSVKLCHKYQVDEFKHYIDLGACEKYDLWSPETYYNLANYYEDRPFPDHFDKVGVYTQGFALRRRNINLNAQYAADADKRERAMLAAVRDYAILHPEVQFVVYLHPYERRHFKLSGDVPYPELNDLTNVKIDLSMETSSTFQFDKVGLGLTTISSIGFERLYMGLRTLFYVADLEHLVWEIQSPFHRLFFTEMPSFVTTIESTRQLTNSEFVRDYGLCVPGVVK